MPLIIDTNGRTVFIGRFLRPIRPPPEVEAISADKKAAAVGFLLDFLNDHVFYLAFFRIFDFFE